MRHRPRSLLLLITLTGTIAVMGASAAVAAAPTHTAARPAKLAVGVEVLRFASAGKTMQATGQVTGILTDNAGHITKINDVIALTAATGGGCRVLHLDLKELTLHLLGLNAHLDRVVLDITGNRSGGVLGSLFCRLARAKVASARSADVRALNAALNQNKIKGQAVRFTAELTPQATKSQAAGATCPVLDLVVGPLNLQLLGLVVDLNRVHLSVTATRGQGKVGDLFCTLADG